jgi:hypothetical protein
MNALIAAVVAMLLLVPFWLRKPGPAFADGTYADPALQAPADHGHWGCESYVLFRPTPKHERGAHIEALRQDRRDHGTGMALPRP